MISDGQSSILGAGRNDDSPSAYGTITGKLEFVNAVAQFRCDSLP